MGLPFGFAQDKKAHAFTGTATAEGVAPTALGTRRLCFPALPGGANFCRAYGAPIDESRFSHRLVRPALSRERRDPSARRYCDSLGTANDLPGAQQYLARRRSSEHRQECLCHQKPFSCQRASGSRRESRGAWSVQSPRLDSPSTWEPCHLSQARLTVDLGALSSLPDTTRRRHWEPCHGGQKLPRLTLIYFGIAVYCGNYACP